jgi:leucyl-tRNA synthetase
MNLFKEIEEKWQNEWYEARIYEAEVDKEKPKLFITFCFPYVNGHLHVGHAFTSLRNDIYARFKRAQGYNVLFPWAWHWTGEPIAGMAKRIAAKDEIMINLLKRTEKVPDEELVKFTDPLYIANYFTNESRIAIKRLGYSIDWRREFNTTSHNKGFSAYVSWQYIKLREKGYVIKGTHPVVWCPRDQSPTGDHDRLQGEGVSPEEIVLIKFKFEDSYLVAATLRPETIFGVTNIWVKPDSDLVKINVNGEKWIVSKETVEKLKGQDFKVEVIEEFKGEKIIGKHAIAPLVNKEIIILPSFFIDPNIGTGIVYSVPSHAPYDYAALRDLKNKPEILQKYGISKEAIDKIAPIHIIDTKGYGEHPAVSLIEKMKIKDQTDARLEEATREIYLNEFNKGVMNKLTQEFEGMKVSEAKNKVYEKMLSLGFALKIYDLLSPVVCRCGTRCIVIILKDQWFLKYSDPEWKEKAKLALSRMRIYPEEARNWFINTIDWLDDKACARKSGLGTPLPWDKEWIIETLSDSTIYMPYYIIAKFVNANAIKAENLKKEFFDYVILGEGNVEEVAKQCEISPDLLKKIREEFLYWYPVDLRTSAKELIPNHLTFYIFHHVALLPENLWPKIIAVNGMINIEGKKLSKSKGIVITIKEAIEKYGADPVRFYLASLAEGMEDAEWTSKGMEDAINNLQSFYNLALKIISNEEKEMKSSMDSWLISSFQRRIKLTTDFLDEFKLRSALVHAFYGVFNDIKWYMKRSETINSKLLKSILRDWLILLSPFIPHICEELWNKLGEKSFIALAKWPSYNPSLIDEVAEAREILITKMYEDISNVRKLKGKVSKIYIYLPSRKKYELFIKVKEKIVSKIDRRELIKEIQKEIKDFEEKKIPKMVIEMYEHYFSLEETLRNVIEKAKSIDESVAKELKKMLEKEEITCEIFEEENAKYDPLNKAERSLPFKLGFYLE